MTTTLSRLTIPALAALLTVSFAFAFAFAVPAAVAADSKDGPKLAHTVFFTLKDHSAESRARFVASCHKYLTGHDGVSFFAVATIADDVSEGAVSDRDFDVSLHAVFSSKETEAAYLKHPRHVQFVEENRPLFARVRVFDSYLTTP